MHHSSSVVYLVYILFAYQCAAEVASPDGKTNSFVTQTVYGFLDFTTTIGKTVMIFSPQSAPTLDISQVPKKVVEIIQTKPYSTDKGKSTEIYPTKLAPSTTQNKKSSTPTTPTTPSTTETARKEYVNQPDYDLLSRQPEAFAEESYHVHDLVSKKKSTSRRNSAPKDPHPVGLVTTLSGKIAMDGTTTIHETSVIGTYISGKYAQVLQSNSHILSPTATSTARILRTESPNLQRPRFKNRASLEERRVTSTSTVEPTTQYSTRKHGSGSKNKAKSRPKNKTSKVLRSSQRESRESSEFSPSASVSHDSRKYAFRQRLQAVLNTTSAAPSTSNVKLRPVGRWQYKSTLKPRVYIRKASDFSSGITPTHSFSSTINDIELNTINSAATEVTAQITNAKTEKSLNVTAEEQIMLYPVETINVDIVTPSNFEDVYYEVATIKTPYTFQMGNVKKTRYVTVTSTTEKVLESEFADKSSIKGPLIENILAPTTQINQQLQASTVQTFSPCTLIDPAETPSLDEFIETYTQSQMKLKTQVFPLIGANQSTSYLTLLQTYAVTTVITATKTTPVCIGNNFNEFNTKLDESGSELHLELEFGDVANLEPENSSGSVEASRVTAVPDDLLKKPSSDEQLQGYYPQLSPEQYQQLAYLKLLQQNAQVPQIVAPPPEIQSSIEPLYESHIIPLIHGTQTSYKTLSKLITRTEQRPEPSTYIPQPLPSLNPFGLPQQQQQFKIITSPIVQPTVLTQTHSRILKLTFGAKTALTTIYSTNILSTAISTYVTTSFPVQATPSFNNFFPPVFPQYPFLG